MLSARRALLVRLLEISFRRIRHIYVDNDTYIWLVDTHAESVGCYHSTAFSGEPAFLTLIFYIIIQTGMIESGSYAVIDQ